MKRYSAKIIFILLVILLGVTGTPIWAEVPRNENVLVTKVFDGDTILVELGGREVTVRLIGVDTPSVDPAGHAGAVLAPRLRVHAARYRGSG
jgi:hypothetical protein